MEEILCSLKEMEIDLFDVWKVLSDDFIQVQEDKKKIDYRVLTPNCLRPLRNSLISDFLNYEVIVILLAKKKW